MPNKPLMVRLPDELRALVDAAASAEGMASATFARRAILESLQTHKTKGK